MSAKSLRKGLAVVTAIFLAVSVNTPSKVSAASSTKYIIDETTRPLGAISVIGDSVMLGSLVYGPNLVEQLAGQGWGPIRARAGMGYSTGHLAVPDWGKVSGWLAKWREEGWDAPNVIVNVGVNDSGLCGASFECSVNSINFLLDEIGPDHRVFWPNITRSAVGARDYQTVWNSALEAVAAERPELIVWDWATLYAGGEFPSGDRIHLSPSAYVSRNGHIASEVTARLVTTQSSGQPVALPQVTSAPSAFSSIPPERILDTRLIDTTIKSKDVISVDLDEILPRDATAVAVNLTSAGSSQSGYFTAFDCATERPYVSHLNFNAGHSRGGFAIIPLPASRKICIFSFVESHVIVDIQGAFSPTGDLALNPSEPTRLLDTRITRRAGTDGILRITVPETAAAVSVTLTVVGAESSGYLTAYPCTEEIPFVSNVNFLPDEPVAGSAFASTSRGEFCIYTSSPVDVIVDLNGTFSETATLHFVSTQPSRLLDTRYGIGGWSPIHARNARIEVPAAPADAAAVTGTFTIVEPLKQAFLTAEPCDARTYTSVVNATDRGILANTSTVAVSDGRLCITASQPTHTLFDVSGWWIQASDS